MALQPANTAEKLYYPSGLAQFTSGAYDVVGLTGTGDRLYDFEVGDYAYPVLLPVPHVELTIFTLDPATVTITVYRTAAKRTTVVRGQVKVYAVGGRNVVDWEAPFGIPVTYRAEQFDVDGQTLGFTTPFSTQLDVEDTWVQNVFEPAKGLKITAAADWGKNLSRPIPTETYWASGGGLGVAISGQRRGLVDAPLPFLTWGEADADRIRSMFGDPYTTPTTTPVVCIRIPGSANMRLPRPLYAVVADPQEVLLDAKTGLTRWECTGTEVAPPAPALVAPILTLADIDASYTSLGQLDSTYLTLFDIDKAYSLSGTATDGDA